jgi:hypothetical protein
MAKKQKMPISAIEAKEAMDLAQRDCDVLWKIEKLLEKIGIAKHKYMLHSRDMWTFSFLRELYHLKHIRPDLSKLIQKTIDDTSKNL